VLQRCFGDRYQAWLPKLKEMVPSLGTKLSNEPKLFDEVWSWGTKVLKLDVPAGSAEAANAPATV
jgi:malate dehydrogenase (quinone)